MYWQIHVYLPILEHLSIGCVSVECRPMYQPIYRPISTNTLGEGKVSVKHRCGIGEVSVKYRWSLGEVSVSHQVYRPIAVSVDTLVDTRLIYRPILDRVSTDTRSSIDRCIDRYCYRSIYLVAHRDFTDTSPILHRCFTDTLPSPSVLVDIGRYITWYIGRHSTDTRPVDKCSSIGRYICRYIGRYIGR